VFLALWLDVKQFLILSSICLNLSFLFFLCHCFFFCSAVCTTVFCEIMFNLSSFICI
jgi:hypothetical protein